MHYILYIINYGKEVLKENDWIYYLAYMYSKAKRKIKWQGQLSDYIDSGYGVLQGEGGMTSPHIFIGFIYNLKSFLDQYQGIYINLADDLILCSDTAEGLQKFRWVIHIS